jgi:hypothetical protein
MERDRLSDLIEGLRDEGVEVKEEIEETLIIYRDTAGRLRAYVIIGDEISVTLPGLVMATSRGEVEAVTRAAEWLAMVMEKIDE